MHPPQIGRSLLFISLLCEIYMAQSGTKDSKVARFCKPIFWVICSFYSLFDKNYFKKPTKAYKQNRNTRSL